MNLGGTCHALSPRQARAAGAVKGEIVVALAGAPNSGKSTLFNMLVGANRFVGNWPGKTVDKYEGFFEHAGYKIRVVDLPGTYSLGAHTEEETVARDYIVSEKPDVVVVLVNAVSLETTLYLAVQVLELYDKVVVALNKVDAAKRRGLHVSAEKLGKMLGVPVVPISALRGEGLHELIDTVIEVATGRVPTRRLKLEYRGLEYYAFGLAEQIRKCPQLGKYPPEWLSLRLLEGDTELEKLLAGSCPELMRAVEAARAKAEEELGGPPSLIAASTRYSFIEKLVSECTTYSGVVERGLGEALDRVFLNSVAGPLVALAVVLSVLVVTFAVNTGFPLVQILELAGNTELAESLERYTLASLLSSAVGSLSEAVSHQLHALGAPEYLVSLVADGVLGGVGVVLSFLPLLLLVFAAFGFLEDTGVMSRIAAVYHGVMRRAGLSGKALMPLLLGFGCNVPAIMGSKILDSDREKLLASLVAPLVPCQARLVVLLVLVSALPAPPTAKVFALLAVYAYSLLLVAAAAKVASRLMGRGEEPELLLELPPYHRPSMRVIWWFAWDNMLHFLKKAGVVIFALSVAMWLLLHTGPGGYTEDASSSYARLLGEALTPLTAAIGLRQWQVALALLTGFIAKEAVVSTLVIATGAQEPVAAAASLGLGPAEIASLMLFSTLYVPCLATVSAFYSRFRSAKLTLALVLYEMAVATFSAAAVYYGLKLLGL